MGWNMELLGESIRAQRLLAELKRRNRLVEESCDHELQQRRLEARRQYHRLFGFMPEQHARVVAELEAIRAGNGKKVVDMVGLVQAENGLSFVPSAFGFASESVVVDISRRG